MSYFEVCAANPAKTPCPITCICQGHYKVYPNQACVCPLPEVPILWEDPAPAVSVDDVHGKLMSTLRSLGYDLDPVADRLLYEALIEASKPF